MNAPTLSAPAVAPMAERRAHRFVRADRASARARPPVDTPLLFDEVAELCPAGIIVIDAQGRFCYANRRAQSMVGLSPEDYQRQDYNAPNWLVSDFDGNRLGPEQLIFSRIIKSGQPLDDVEHAVQHRNGNRVYLRISGQPVFKDDGVLHQVIFTLVDVTAVVETSRALRQSEQRFASALDHAPIGMAIVSLEGRFTLVNQALCHITGYEREELQDLTFQEITYPDDLKEDLHHVQQLLAGEVSSYQMEKRYVRKDGGIVWIRLSVSLPRDDHGRPLYFISQIEDINDSREAAERIRISEERLRLMLDSVVDYAIYMLDTGGRITMWNPGCERILGYSADESMGQHMARFCLPEDARAGKPERQLAAAEHSGRHEDESWRVRKDGTRFWANVVLTALRSEEGRLRGFCMVMRDLSASRRAELELREGKERLEQSMLMLQRQNREISEVSELSNILQSCLHSEEIYTPIRRYCRTLFQGCAGALYVMQGQHNGLECVVHWDCDQAPLAVFEPPDCWALRRGQIHEMCNEDDLRCAHVPANLNRDALCVPMMAQSEILGLLHLQPNTAIDALASEEQLAQRRKLAEMVAERIGMAIANLRLRETLRNQSIRDPLTKLFNRRYLEETLRRELAQARRSGTQIALLMMDIDHFKKYNDTHGHEAGDAALVAVAGVLQSKCRSSDMTCRYGGEELVMVLTGTTLEHAEQRADEARRAVASATIVSRGKVLPAATISIGLALYPTHATDATALLTTADKALYEAKAAGRNCVRVHAETKAA